MSYHLAPALAQLRTEVNILWPGRDRTSDGWVGDVSHSARVSDHNPDYRSGGVVRALDVDKDGMDHGALVAAAIRDHRTEYVIFAGQIYQRKYGFKPRRYTGPNGHYGHIHISIRHGSTFERDGSGWGLAISVASAVVSRPPLVAPPLTRLPGVTFPTLTQEDEMYRIHVKTGPDPKEIGKVFAVHPGPKGVALFKHLNPQQNASLDRLGVPIRDVSHFEKDQIRLALIELEADWRVA